MLALVAGRVAAEHIGARDLRERHDPSTIRRGKRVGGLPISERDSLGRTHAALLAAVAPGLSQLVARAMSET